MGSVSGRVVHQLSRQAEVLADPGPAAAGTGPADAQLKHRPQRAQCLIPNWLLLPGQLPGRYTGYSGGRLGAVSAEQRAGWLRVHL